MPFISDTASAIKSRFGFQDHTSNSANPPRGSPDFLKSAAKESVAQTPAIRSIGEFNDEDDAVGDVAGSSGQVFELREDPSFWKDHNVQVRLELFGRLGLCCFRSTGRLVRSVIILDVRTGLDDSYFRRRDLKLVFRFV